MICNHKAKMKAFLAFCKKYEDDVKEEEASKFFGSKTNRFEWRLVHQKRVGELYRIFLGVQAEEGGSMEE